MVRTKGGRICGVVQSRPAAKANAYLGVPFAKPPTGPRRWQDPQPPRKWKGVRRATNLSATCAQIDGAPTVTGFIGKEDCLYLNVWTPAKRSPKPRATVFYIPGGGFLVGGGTIPTYNGAYMAASGNVNVVTINYRLGSLGFLRSPGQGIEGNFGVKDQLAALRWVHANSAAFRGDPAKITVMGESAGAVSAALMLYSVPTAAPLFRSAIMDSNIAGTLLPTGETMAATGSYFVDILCQYRSACPKTIGWLRSLPLKTVMTAANKQAPANGIHGLFIEETPRIPFAPAIGVAPITGGQPIEGFHPGNPAKPFVMGHNRDEGGFFVPFPQWTTDLDYNAWLDKTYGVQGADSVRAATVQGKNPYAVQSYKFDKSAQMTPGSQALMQAITDGKVAAPNIYTQQRVQQQMSAAGLPMFAYQFSKVASFNYQGLAACSTKSKNVCHSYELPFVFNNFVQLENGEYVSQRGSKSDRRVAKAMTRAWTGFAKKPTAAGWGYPPITNPSSGPAVDFAATIRTINDTGTRTGYDTWQPIIEKLLN